MLVARPQLDRVAGELARITSLQRRLEHIHSAGIDYTRLDLRNAYHYASMLYFFDPTATYKVDDMRLLVQFLGWESYFDFDKIQESSLSSVAWYHHVEKVMSDTGKRIRLPFLNS